MSLKEKHVGIVGYGAVGSLLPALLSPFQCSFSVCEIDPSKWGAIQQQSFELSSLEKLLKISDVISLHVPLTSTTKHMIAAPQFSMMKKTAILVNTSRGQVIDESALKKALRTNQILGAGLDVFAEEPVRDPELFSLEPLVATAHMAGNSREAVWDMGKAAIEGVQAYLLQR